MLFVIPCVLRDPATLNPRQCVYIIMNFKMQIEKVISVCISIFVAALYMACAMQQKDAKQWFAELSVDMDKVHRIHLPVVYMAINVCISIFVAALYMACAMQQKDAKQWFAELSVDMDKVCRIHSPMLTQASLLLPRLPKLPGKSE